MELGDRLALAVWAFLLAGAVTLVATPIAARLAHLVGAVDEPGDERRVHSHATPLLGGVAVGLGVLASTLLFGDFQVTGAAGEARVEQLLAVLAGAAAVCVLGALDDIFDLRWWLKLAGQVGVALGAILGPLAGGAASAVSELILPLQRLDPPLLAAWTLPAWLAVALAALWIVALMNMMNFIDGVDGLASGIAGIGAGTFAVIAASYSRMNVAILAAATAGAAVAFLRHNFRRSGASIFLGDAGSLLFGYLLAVISIQGVLKTAAAVSLIIPLAMLAVPILDTLFVVSKRLKYNVSVASPDRWHLHHRLLNVGYSPRRVTYALWGWTASMSAVALALRFVDYGNSKAWEPRGLAILGAVGVLAVGVSVWIAVTLEIIKTRAVRDRNARLLAARVARGESGARGAAEAGAAAVEASLGDPQA